MTRDRDRQHEPHGGPLGGIELSQFQSGDQLEIYLDNTMGFFAHITDPQKGQALVRPTISGQLGAGYRDAQSTLGSRSFQRAHGPHVSHEVDPEIRWGRLMCSDELVLRNEDTVFGTEGHILYTGRRITSVIGSVVRS